MQIPHIGITDNVIFYRWKISDNVIHNSKKKSAERFISQISTKTF